MRIAAIPRVFARATEKYRGPFSARQFAHFVAYLLGLTVGREGRNVQDIAALFVRACDQATLNHFLTEAPWSLARLWARHREIVAEAIRRVGARRVFLSLDDTVSWKRWGLRMEGAGWHYSTTMKALVWGHDAVAALVSAGGEAYVWGIALYRPKRACAAGAFRTKIDLALAEIETFAPPAGAAATVLADCWYFCHRLARAAEARGFDWVFGCKRNRVVRVAGRRATVSRLIQRLSLDELERVAISGRHYVVASRLVDFPGLGPGQLVIGAEVPKSGRRIRRADLRVIACNRQDWRARTVLSQYVQRHRIEDFFKDAKGHLGLGEYQLRKAEGIQRHWALVACAHTVLRLLPAGGRGRTIGEAALWIEDLTQEAAMKWAHARGLRGVKWRSPFLRAA